MTYQHRQSRNSCQRSPRAAASIVAITLAGIALACSDNTYLGHTQSLAGAPSTTGSVTASGAGSGVAGSGVSTYRSGTMGSGAMGSGAMGSGAMGSGATGATGAMGSGATGAMGSGATGAMGSGATGAMGSGATGAMGSGATGATGAIGSGATGATGNVGGSTSFVCDALVFCERPMDCVERCGGAVLQSGCCPCPSGTFDSYVCGVGGATSTGGTGNQGGVTSTATTSSGGTTSTMPSGSECGSDTDCRIEGDCCGCYSFGPGQSSSCPMECLTSATCNGFDPQPVPRCIAGRCTLNRSCDDRKVTCKRMTPACEAGKLPSLMEGDLCWDGNCIDIVDCSAVTGCDVCKNNGLLCVYDASSDVAHCVAQ